MYATPQRTTRRPGSPSYVTPPTAESASPARSPVSPSPEKAQLDMLAKQLHVLRQREVQQAAEMDRLRRLLGEQQAANGSTFQTPPKALGASASRNDFMDEVERLRREKRELQVHNCELEVQIQDAANSIEGFSAAIESLETGYKQKEETWKRQIATLQTECQAQVHANRELKREYEEELAAKDDLVSELRATASSAQASTATTTSTLSSDLAAAQATIRSKESLLESLHTQLETLRAEHDAVAAACAASADDAANWKTKYADATKQVESMALRLKQAHAATSASGQSILVKTLRDEVRLIQSRLEAQFKADKDTLLQRTSSLQSQLAESTRTIAEKDRSIFTLNAKLEDQSRKHAALVHTNQQLEATVARLTKEVATAQDDLAQLQQCRGFLDHHLDVGFQELFRDEDALAAARAEAESLRAECARLERQVELKAVWQQQVHELQTQLRANEQLLATSSDAASQLAALQSTHAAVVANVAALEAQNASLTSQVAAAADLPRLTTEVHEQHTTIQRLEAEVAKRKSGELKLRGLLERQQRAAEQASTLDKRLADVLAESKKDRTDLVALRAMVQAAKLKIQKYEADREGYKVLEQKYRDARSMHHVLKKENESLRTKMQSVAAQGSAGHEAQLQHMQRVVETHTKELVAEIETLQRQYQSQLSKYKRMKKDREHMEMQLRDRNAYIATLEARKSPLLRTKAPSVVVTAGNQEPLKLKELHHAVNPADEMESILTTLERISDKYK
ncbi:hypothetical protein SPRG_20729 [Saprolegnia parasitica CBS 223.65]|uniref:Uncharacterized protein n=1 Tax=Saprolegnia parasitica (strain CBS 223.65) TaxID=695850 RepID=A0A067C832_SAPPC|nr:hypothetical protein SPRG_20729 [Saprolegnia parasitica CBS 223.65]KDO25320.1 hypothetical protein SPRG_20729 [Saprolegnia parasitica CBS 223.65]|eukprot:XP_012204020.1 hypothetical protein SPRG_20729 [Saprolegnia parasitica CBS 223.65]